MTAETHTPDAPWPIVGECYWPAQGLVDQNHTCGQCDGSHAHVWVAWHDAPGNRAGGSVVGGSSGPGLPVRCRVCGGRKCDTAACRLRRHHHDDHEEF